MTNTTNQQYRTAYRTSLASTWVVGGLLWLVAGLMSHADGWRFTVSSIIWLAADVALLLGIIALMRIRPHGSRISGQAALVVALIGRLLFAAAEVLGLIQGSEQDTLLPIAAMVTALSMTWYGVTVARVGALQGIARWAPLTMGLYPFIAMFPLVAMTENPPTLSIALWGIPIALVATTASLPTSQP